MQPSSFLSLAILIIMVCLHTSDSCTAFYCLNSCGSRNSGLSSPKQGFKLVVAVNRDEAVDRPTLSASVWPSKKNGGGISLKWLRNGFVECDQSKMEPPYNLCVYGPLDVAGKPPPEYYSTWLGIFCLLKRVLFKLFKLIKKKIISQIFINLLSYLNYK